MKLSLHFLIFCTFGLPAVAKDRATEAAEQIEAARRNPARVRAIRNAYQSGNSGLSTLLQLQLMKEAAAAGTNRRNAAKEGPKENVEKVPTQSTLPSGISLSEQLKKAEDKEGTESDDKGEAEASAPSTQSLLEIIQAEAKSINPATTEEQRDLLKQQRQQMDLNNEILRLTEMSIAAKKASAIPPEAKTKEKVSAPLTLAEKLKKMAEKKEVALVEAKPAETVATDDVSSSKPEAYASSSEGEQGHRHAIAPELGNLLKARKSRSPAARKLGMRDSAE